MKDSLKFSGALASQVTPKLFFLFIWLVIFTPSAIRAQIYFDGGWEYSEYINQGDFNSDPIQHNFRFSLGCIVYQKENGFFHAGADITNFSRVLRRDLYGDDYRYEFRGLSFNFFAGIEPLENLKVEAGIGLAFYGTRFEKNGEKSSIDEGFESFDYSVTGRMYYYITPSFAFGISSARWLNPMLSYTPIGDFGEFLEEERWIEAITYNVFLRYQIANTMKR